MKLIEAMKRIKELTVKAADLQQKVSVTCANLDIETPVYADPKEFRDHFGMTKGGYGSYFRDMVLRAVREARENFNNHLRKQAAKEIEQQQAILNQKLKEARK